MRSQNHRQRISITTKRSAYSIIHVEYIPHSSLSSQVASSKRQASSPGPTRSRPHRSIGWVEATHWQAHGTMKSPRTCVASALFLLQCHAFNGQFGRPTAVSVSNTMQSPPEELECDTCDTARRSLLMSSVLLLTAPATSNAAVDCFTDCLKNCVSFLDYACLSRTLL